MKLIKENSHNFEKLYSKFYNTNSFERTLKQHINTDTKNKSFLSLYHYRKNVGFAILREAQGNNLFLRNLESKYNIILPKNNYVYISLIQKLQVPIKGMIQLFVKSLTSLAPSSGGSLFVMSEIRNSNVKSMKAHEKAGFKIISTNNKRLLSKNGRSLLMWYKNDLVKRCHDSFILNL